MKKILDFTTSMVVLVVVLLALIGLVASLCGLANVIATIGFCVITMVIIIEMNIVAEELYEKSYSYLIQQLIAVIGSIVATALILKGVNVIIVNGLVIIYWIALMINLIAENVYEIQNKR